MKHYDFNINGNDIISGKGFSTEKEMVKWTKSTLKEFTPEEGAEVIVTLTVIDKVTTSHFIKHKFVSAITGERGGVTIEYTKI